MDKQRFFKANHLGMIAKGEFPVITEDLSLVHLEEKERLHLVIKSASYHKSSTALPDQGTFWVSSERVGFNGKVDHFSLKFSEILKFSARRDILVMIKAADRTEYSVQVSDPDVAEALIPQLILKKKAA